MANTFTEIYIHHVSAVKYRNSLISSDIESRVYAYIAEIIKENDQTLLEINGMPDHIHIVIRLRGSMAISKLIQLIKGSTSKFINDNKLTKSKFAWQRGGGTFSISPIEIEPVRHYVRGQKEHHKKKSFREEYIRFLENNSINVDPKYLPEFFD